MATVVEESAGKSFTPIKKGLHVAALAEVVTLPKKVVKYANNEKEVTPGFFIFQTNTPDEEGRRQEVWHYITNMTLGSADKPSNLRKFLTEWLGSVPKRIDLDTLVGKVAELMIKHQADKNDPNKVYANIAAIEETNEPFTVEGYIPYAERKKAQTSTSGTDEDDDVPF